MCRDRTIFMIAYALSFQIALALSSGSSAAEVATQDASQTASEHAETPKDHQEIDRLLSDFVEAELKDKSIPSLSIVLVNGDKVALARGFGHVDEDKKRPAADTTIYRVGSVSKLFTDLCVMQLVGAGKLDLDTDVREYLPAFQPHNPFGVPITLRMLMSHQSGLVREPPVGSYFDDTSPSLADTVSSLNSTTIVYRPGARTKYSNAGISVVGLVLERLAGQPFEEHVRKVLLEPLEMPSSGFRFSEAMNRDLAIGWMRSHHAPPFTAPNYALGTLPAGNLYASMSELSHFLIAALNDGKYRGKQVIDPKLLQSMLQPSTASDDRQHDYGIGFRLGELDGHRTFGHGGAVYGYSTQLLGLPDENVGVVASASLDGANGVVRRLTEYAVRLLLAHKSGKTLPLIEPTRPIPREDAQKLTGSYFGGSKSLQVLEEAGETYVFDGAYRKRLRLAGNEFVIDDLTGFGPRIKRSGDTLLLAKDRAWKRVDEPKPPPAPARFKPFIGEYGWDYNVLYIYEDRGRLWALIEWFDFCPLTEISTNVFAFPEEGLYHGEQIVFERDENRPASYATVAGVRFNRRPVGLDGEKPFRIQVLEPIDELYRIAKKATPPAERNRPRAFDLVELTTLDPSIKLDIRYATNNNFMGAQFYKQARAFLQHPAAEALVRVHGKLKKKGFGLQVYDAYRPWYVTKMFWEGTAGDQHAFVANPSEGSKHNRGCAVDLTLYELDSGKEMRVVSGYDEMSQRSYPFYPGGTSEERWHRQLLRHAMESEGFTVYPTEWWHFDYKDWQLYPIGTLSFEEIPAADASTP